MGATAAVILNFVECPIADVCAHYTSEASVQGHLVWEIYPTDWSSEVFYVGMRVCDWILTSVSRMGG
jgi:hypothetical protein